MHAGTVCQRVAVLALLSGLVSARADTGAPSLELPRIDGAAIVRLSDFPGRAVLINIWSVDCPPCRAETPLLRLAAQLHPQVQFVGISVDAQPAAYRYMQTLPPDHGVQLLAPHQPDGLMRRLGNPSGALPYTLLLNAAHQACATHTGQLDPAWLDTALATCTHSH